jgi:hypothetical protein
MLITSFIINPGPPPNPTIAQFIEFGNHYRNSILMGAWLQAVSPPLIVVFALAIVHLAGAASKFSGWLTFFGGIILVIVSMIEITFYFSAINGNPLTSGFISLDFIGAVQHLYSIIAAPMFFFTLSVVILGSRILPHVFGYVGLFLGSTFAVLGLLALFNPLQNIINYVSITQGFWWLFATVTLLIRASKISGQEVSTN